MNININAICLSNICNGFKQLPSNSINNCQDYSANRLIKTNNTINKNITFGIKQQAPVFAEELSRMMSKTSKENLILFLQKEFEKKTKIMFPRYCEDIVQNALKYVLECIVLNPKKEDLKSYILDIYQNKLKPTKYDRQITDYETFSIERDDKKSFLDKLTVDKILQPLSIPNIEDREFGKEKLNKAILHANLTEKECSLLEKRLGNKVDNRMGTYKEIADEENKSMSTVRRQIITTLLKIQKSNGVLPNDFLQFAKDFKSRFKLDFSDEEMLDYLIENSFLEKNKLDKYEENVKILANKFKDNGLSAKSYVACCIKQPTLFYQLPETIERNIRTLVDKFREEGLDTKSYLDICLKKPHFFQIPSETIERNVRTLVEKFKTEGLDTKSYISACKKQPQLFCQLPETIEKNVRTLVEKFKTEGLDTKSYISACKKRPQLFCQLSETIEKNVRTLVEKFKTEGLDAKSYVEACKKQPQLFYLSPETIEKNIRTLVNKFKAEGLDIKSYVEACKKQPQLFYQSPDTIEKNVRTLVYKLKNEGLDIKSYLDICKKRPQLFCQSPETIERNIRTLVERFKDDNLNTKFYLDICKKQQSLFFQSPETICEHINAYKYIEKNKLGANNDIVIKKILSKNLSLSTALIYLQGILMPQLKKQNEEIETWGHVNLKSKLINFYKMNPEKKFKITVVEDKMTPNFVRTMKDFCAKNLGENDMFEFVILDK